MEIAKMTSKGQLTIPKDVRIALGLNTGDKVLFIEKDGVFFIVKDTPKADMRVNIDGVSASLAMEDIETTDEMLDYAEKRLRNATSYASKIAEITKKYAYGK